MYYICEIIFRNTVYYIEIYLKAGFLGILPDFLFAHENGCRAGLHREIGFKAM